MRRVLFLFLCVPAFLGANPSLTYREVDLGGAGLYVLEDHRGVLYSADSGSTWSERNAGLPIKVVYPFDRTELRDVVGLSVDPTDPHLVAVVTDDALFASDDGGLSWTEIAVEEPVKSVDVFTSVARVPQSPEELYLGTSFNGMFYTQDGGATWVSLDESLSMLYRGAGFYEEVRAIAVSPTDPGRIVIAAGFGAGLFESTDAGATWMSLEVPGSGAVLNVYFRNGKEGRPELIVDRPEWRHVRVGSEGGWVTSRRASPPEEVRSGQEETARAARIALASNRHGIYVNSAYASGDRLAGHLALVAEQGFNSIVVDMKDDAGYLTYDTELDVPKKANAVRERFGLDELVATVHAQGVYLIGRIVVFQDPRLYRYLDGAYAVWNEETDSPWGNLIPVYNADGELIRREQREFWVDPFSEEVWKYNVAIADELQRRGVDEVQFDYVRFPSDGDLSTITYRYQREGMSKTDALESLLRLARENLEIPLGVDVFGFNGWYRMGNWIGQNIPVLSHWVDAVSPMFYPSHYPRSFLGDLTYFDRAETIYRVGSDRAAMLVDGAAIIRPYVQAFLIGGERAFEEDQYDEYLTRELDGVIASKASGFTLWNASNIYYMIVSPLESYTHSSE